MQRRTRGATLALVVVCMLIIILIGIFAFFLAKLMGGGREVANATDAGALNNARQALTVSTAPATSPFDFRSVAYPAGSGITLLTYNRCVAAALLVAINASNEGTTDAVNHAKAVVNEVNQMGQALKAQLSGVNNFDQVAGKNGLKMFGNSGISGSHTQVSCAFMKPGGDTNIYFGTDSLDGYAVPLNTASLFSPLNPGQYASNPTAKYMAGYVPITTVGGTMYGTPVFPQRMPHLVALFDYNQSAGGFGSAPPNAFGWTSSAADRMTASLGGAVACAIVGAIQNGTAPGDLGTGFQFAAAMPYGYIEFLNWPANPVPPGFDINAINDSNVFNQEMGGGFDTWVQSTSGGTTNTGGTEWVAFSTSGKVGDYPAGTASNANTLTAWLNWAKSGGTPPTGNVFIGPADGTQAVTYNSDKLPTGQALTTLQTIAQNYPNPEDCGNDLNDSSSGYGLRGACVSGFGTMLATFGHKVPVQGNQNNLRFSQVDFAKASVLVAFQGKNDQTSGFGGTSAVSTSTQQMGGSNDFNKTVKVTLSNLPDSGLGVYTTGPSGGTTLAFGENGAFGQREPSGGGFNHFAVPAEATLPLQSGTKILDMMYQVMSAGCVQQTLNDMLVRCQQIQPKTSMADLLVLLRSDLPMSQYAGASSNVLDQQANKCFIYLPNGDLNNKLVISAPMVSGHPGDLMNYPGFADSMNCPGPADCPDGKNPQYDTSDCYSQSYSLDGNLVDTDAMGVGSVFADESVHIAPYVNTDGALNATDHAWWWPGSGATGTLGRLTFRETGTGSATFSHIN